MDGRSVYLRQANEALKAEMEEGRRNFNILAEDEAECPVCKHPLGADGKEHLRTEYEQRGLEQKNRYLQNDTELKSVEAKHGLLSAQVRRREDELARRRSQLDGETATLRSRLNDAVKAGEELLTAGAWYSELESNLSTGSFALEEKASLRGIEEELAAVDYDPERRREIDRGIAGLPRDGRRRTGRVEPRAYGAAHQEGRPCIGS